MSRAAITKILPTKREAVKNLGQTENEPAKAGESIDSIEATLRRDIFGDPDKLRVLAELARTYSATELANIRTEASTPHDVIATGTIAGVWSDIASRNETAQLVTPTGQTLEVNVGPVAWGGVVRNLDGKNLPVDPSLVAGDEMPANAFPTYAQHFWRPGQQVIVRGSAVDGQISVMQTTLPGQRPGEYVFEQNPKFYTDMLARLSKAWHARISDEGSSEITANEVKNYRTNILGFEIPLSDSNLQQVAHLSRIGYGFGADARANGGKMAALDAKAMAEYAIENFQLRVNVPKSVSGASTSRGQFNYAGITDLKKVNPELAALKPSGEFTLWSAALLRKDVPGPGDVLRTINESQLSDNAGLRSIYEDIYALAQFSELYALTLDPGVLSTIESGIDAMLQFYYDPVNRGFYTHLDDNLQATSPDGTKKYNWNSIGDHLPAYLFSLLTALGPSTGPDDPTNRVREKALFILKECTSFITGELAKPVMNGETPFVNERLNADLSVDANQFSFAPDNAPVLGHNMKIVWNMVRAHNALKEYARHLPEGSERKDLETLAEKGKQTAQVLAEKSLPFAMGPNGESYDIIARKVEDGFKLIYGTKDAYWQSEQMIFAMFSMLSITGDPTYLELARLAQLQYVANHLDIPNQTVHFGSAGGKPEYEEGQISRPDKGYHETELAFYSEVFNSVLVTNEDIKRHLVLSPQFKEDSIPVLPDFLPPGSIEIAQVTIGGRPIEYTPGSPEASYFRIPIPEDMRNRTTDLPVTVTFRSTGQLTDAIERSRQAKTVN